MELKLTDKQTVQELDYSGPYHWYKPPFSRKSRLYFGYLSQSIDICTIKDKSQAVILDAGCGDGRFLKEAEEAGFKHLYGVDYSERAVSFGRLLLPEADFAAGELSKLPYDNETFDVIFMIETLEHLIPDHIPAVMTELARILKPEGQLIITTPSDALPPGPKHYQHFNVTTMTEAVAPQFVIDEIRGQDYMPFHPYKLLDRLADNKFWTWKFLQKLYNIKIWPRYFNHCRPETGRRVIARCLKKTS